MFGYKHNAHHDDEDIEIVDLDRLNEQDAGAGMWHGEGTSNRQRIRDEQRRGSVYSAKKSEHACQTTDVSSSPLAPRYSLRQRYVQVGVTACLVGVILCGLVFGNVALRRELLNVIFPPTPGTTGSGGSSPESGNQE
jgi:hypothetical protein